MSDPCEETISKAMLLESLGPFARSDDEVPEIMAERVKARDYVEIPFPQETLEAAAKAYSASMLPVDLEHRDILRESLSGRIHPECLFQVSR